MRVDFEIRGPNMRAVSDRAVKTAVRAVCQQALKDCNKYCKMDTGALIQSSLIHSDDNSGELLRFPFAGA